MADNKKDIFKTDKKNWYNDRYEFVVVQRNVLALITVLALLLSVVTTFSIYQLAPLKSVEPFMIQVDQKTGVTQVVDPLKSRELTANEAVNQYFAVQYCRARESYIGGGQDRNYYNYNIVRVLSDTPVFMAYQRDISLNNPDSVAVRLSNEGSREIHVESAKYLDRRNPTGSNDEIIRYLIKARITERFAGGQPKVMQKLILMEFKYVELELSAEDRYLNPIGFRVTSYRVDEDNLTQ